MARAEQQNLKVGRSMSQILSDIQDEAKTWVYAGNKGLQRLLSSSIDLDAHGQQAVVSEVVVASNM